MKSFQSKIIYFLLPAVVLIGTMILVGSTNEDQPEGLKHMAEHVTTVSLNPPDELNFAGEFVPVWDFDIRERFDQQLIRNVFFHSSTIMTLKRSSRWKKEMTTILKKEGIPEDFFYLCVAESHLTNATSPAGAKGFWQFMKNTGRQFGLEINGEIDERLDPIKSTYAACKYLKAAYKKFGDWTLVAASYNMGMAGVENALKRQQVDSYYDLYLNRETSAYVFRIVALKSIMEDPENYGFTLTGNDFYGPLAYKSVKVTESIEDLVPFALEKKTTYKMLKVMNPWLLSDKLSVAEGSSYTLKIPVNSNVDAPELMGSELDSIAGTDVPKTDSLDQNAKTDTTHISKED